MEDGFMGPGMVHSLECQVKTELVFATFTLLHLGRNCRGIGFRS